MPDFKKFRVDVLAEDRAHFNFIRGFLVSKGVESRKISPVEDFSENKGSGEKRVRNHFADAIIKLRKNRENLFLVVAIDADPGKDPSDRKEELNEELTQKGLDKISKDDRLVTVIPKRNIETWFAWVDAKNTGEKNSINEDKDYKLKYLHAKAYTYGKKISDIESAYRSGDINSISCEKLNSLRVAYDDYYTACCTLESYLNKQDR